MFEGLQVGMLKRKAREGMGLTKLAEVSSNNHDPW